MLFFIKIWFYLFYIIRLYHIEKDSYRKRFPLGGGNDVFMDSIGFYEPSRMTLFAHGSQLIAPNLMPQRPLWRATSYLKPPNHQPLFTNHYFTFTCL